MDESTKTIGKRLEGINVENTEANRQAYRGLLFTTPNIGNYISGAILYEETLFQVCACFCLLCLCLLPSIEKSYFDIAASSHSSLPPLTSFLSEQRGRHPLRQEPELRRRDPGY